MSAAFDEDAVGLEQFAGPVLEFRAKSNATIAKLPAVGTARTCRDHRRITAPMTSHRR